MPDMPIEALLARAAARTVYPPPPDLRPRVLAAIRQDATHHTRRAPLFTRPAALAFSAIVAAAVVAIGGVLAVPTSRSAIADFFGVRGEKIERLPPPGADATPLPTPSGIEEMATPSTLDAAAAAIGFTPALPVDGEPDTTYLVQFGGETVVVLQYERYDLWQSNAIGFFEKQLPASAVLHEFQIKGYDAAWISGGNHIVRFADGNGTPVAGSQRTVGRNTLVWSTDAANYRIETDLPEEEAIAIAESLP